MNERDENEAVTCEDGRTALTGEQIEKVDAILGCWTHAASSIPGSADCTSSINGKPCIGVNEAVSHVVRALQTLAHCTTLMRFNDMAAGRKSSVVAGPHGDARGFIRAALILQRLASMPELKYKSVYAPTDADVDAAFGEIDGARRHVTCEIERAVPGWRAAVLAEVSAAERERRAAVIGTAEWESAFVKEVERQDELAARDLAKCVSVNVLGHEETEDERYRSSLKAVRCGHPSPEKMAASIRENVERIRRNKAKCFAKGKPSKAKKHGGFRPEDFK